MTTTLATITPAGQKLAAAPAASFKRLQAAYGKTLPVTSAWRSESDQQKLYDGWVAKRPGYNFALHPSKSNHCKGHAVDFGSGAYTWLEKNAAAYGWIQDKNERWHYDYVASKDTKKPTSSGTTPTTSSALKKGSKGAKVTALQKGLRATFPAYRNSVKVKKGQLLGVDGVYGDQTDAWVKEFQKRVGLDPDGVVGAKTLPKLKAAGITL